MASLLLVSATLAIAYFGSYLLYFCRNAMHARKSGFPSVYVPLNQNNILWIVFQAPLLPHLRRYLPKFLFDRLILTTYGWEFHGRNHPFENYSGPRGDDKSYMLVTCGRSELWTRDAEIMQQVLARPRDFLQLSLVSGLMSKFGHNVFSSNGDQWAKQRKIIASSINERVSKAVFDESVKQTTGLLAEVDAAADETGTKETNQLFNMVKKITINVLSGSGMGGSVPWEDDSMEKPKPGFRQTYIQTVKTIIENVAGPMILPNWAIANWPIFLPGRQAMKSLWYAIQEFPVHTTELLDAERDRAKSPDYEVKNHIMSQLIQASEQPMDANTKAKPGKTLSDSEMIGNLFVFTAAGFETTANTVSYALALLARYTKWQDWVMEEVDQILPSDPSAELEYTSTFPKAVRTQAFMFETLRLFTPLVHIVKETEREQTIQTSKGSYWLPRNTNVFLNLIALHADPAIWHHLNLAEGEKGSEDDVWQFRPTRWLNPAGSTHALFQPPKGTFMPWSAGPRVCPGQKMAQVEFVGIFLTLLRKHRIEAVPLDGESRHATEARLEKRMRDSVSVMTLQMNDVYEVTEQEKRGLRLRTRPR